MRYLVDAQLPPSLARWLGEQGYSAISVRDVGLLQADDGSIFDFAASGNWAVITKDEDFATRCIGNDSAPAVVWLRLGNCANRVLFDWLKPFLPEIERRLHDGEHLIEMRRA